MTNTAIVEARRARFQVVKTPDRDPTKFYTKGEEIANAVTHGAGALLGVVGTAVLATLCAVHGSAAGVAISLVYGMSLIILYTMSTLYHAVPQEAVKRRLRVCDHSTIFLLIAGSYTPFLLVLLRGGVKGPLLCALLWVLAAAGIVLNLISIDRFAVVSMILYVGMGWAALWTLRDLVRAMPAAGTALLFLGGVCYTGGIVFYAVKKRWMHSIWHLFVLAGSALHFACIAAYVLPQLYVH